MARNTWRKLPDGSWGIAVWGAEREEGEQVRVTRKDGRSTTVELGEEVGGNGQTRIYRVADGQGPGEGQDGSQGSGQGSGQGEGEQSSSGQQNGSQGQQGEQGEGQQQMGAGDEGEPEPFQLPEPGSEEFCEQQQDEFYAEWLRLRTAINKEREQTGEQLDNFESMRMCLDAERAFAQGLSARAMLHSMVAHWPEEAKIRHNALYEVNYAKEGGKVPAGMHEAAGYVIKLAAARIPILLVGPAGVGKSHLTESVAELLGTSFSDTSMTAGATPAWLLGRWTMGTNPEGDEYERKGFVHAPMTRQYVSGGVSVFEEIDSADANMLLVMNKAIANHGFNNPINGERLDRSDEWVPMACSNTFGLGANSQYTGRERLDLATIDRFRMGRVILGLDLGLLQHLIKQTRTKEQARKQEQQ